MQKKKTIAEANIRLCDPNMQTRYTATNTANSVKVEGNYVSKKIIRKLEKEISAKTV